MCTTQSQRARNIYWNTHIHVQCFHGNQAATLLFNSRGRWLLCRVCLGGRGGGSRGVRGGSIKQRTRQMKALHILKSNHNLVITRRWYDQNKEGNRQDWQDRERPECTSQGKVDVRLLLDGKWWTEMVLFLKLMLICCINPYIQARALSLKGFQTQLHCCRDSGNTWTSIHAFSYVKLWQIKSQKLNGNWQ